jgi:predicted membrane channel-forming protein YqfA (hemolysin III family)
MGKLWWLKKINKHMMIVLLLVASVSPILIYPVMCTSWQIDTKICASIGIVIINLMIIGFIGEKVKNKL